MKIVEYLDRLLLRYSGTFDIYKPYVVNQREYPAYGYFFSHIEKYVLMREANLWTTESFEHILFITADALTEEHLKEADNLFRTYMEPVLVRNGEKNPKQNHMYSFLTIVLLCEKPLTQELRKKVKKYKFEKGYMFNVRGYSQGRLIAVSMEDEAIIHNRAAAKMKNIYTETFADIKKGKIGFEELMEKQGKEPFKQTNML